MRECKRGLGVLLLAGVMACVVVDGTVGAGTHALGGVGKARRLFPAHEGWMVRVCLWREGRQRVRSVHEARQLFRAEAISTGEGITSAAWHVDGPEEKEKPGELVKNWGSVVSEYELRVRTPGQYTVTCRFVGEDANDAVVAWLVTVTDETWGSVGRKLEDPSELGQMTFIEGGNFLMGAPAPSARGGGDAVPAHQVRVDDFYIGTHLVTATEFCEFLNERGNPDGSYLATDEEMERRVGETIRFPGLKGCNIYYDAENEIYRPRPNRRYCPANAVTWLGAVEYCRWLSERTGQTYRLPTEAEWEYVARGPEGRKYPWGSNDPFPKGKGDTPEAARPYVAVPDTGAEAAYIVNWFPAVTVGSFPLANTPNGVADLATGLGQWCSDIYSEDYYAVSPRDNPTGPTSTAEQWRREHYTPLMRVVRGADVGYYTNYDDVLLWPIIPENYYYMSPAWTRGAATPGYGGRDERWMHFPLHSRGFRVVREAEVHEDPTAPGGEMAALQAMHQAMKVYREGDPLEAMKLLEEACETHPGNRMLWAGMMMVARGVERGSEGEAAERAVANQRRAADALWDLGHSMLEQGLTTFEEASEVAKDLHMAALSYHALGETRAAVRALDGAKRATGAMAELASEDSQRALAATFARMVADLEAELPDSAIGEPE